MVGDYSRAQDHLDQALRVAGEIECQWIVAFVLSHRADVTCSAGDVPRAWQDARQALQIAREVGGVQWPGMAHLASARLYREQGDPAATRACYTRALELLGQIRSPPWIMESLAGLACAELALGELGQAKAHVAEILAHLDGGGHLCCDQKPIRVYLTCYQVLEAAGDPRADELLSHGHAELQEWAARIPDEALRRSYLENVADNLELVRAWEAAQAGVSPDDGGE